MSQKFEYRFMYDKDKYKLVIEYFSMILDQNFLLALAYFSEKTVYTYKYRGIEFGYDEIGKNKVATFFNLENEITVDIVMFLNSLKLACEIYIEDNIISKEEVIKLFKIVCNNLLTTY